MIPGQLQHTDLQTARPSYRLPAQNGYARDAALFVFCDNTWVLTVASGKQCVLVVHCDASDAPSQGVARELMMLCARYTCAPTIREVLKPGAWKCSPDRVSV